MERVVVDPYLRLRLEEGIRLRKSSIHQLAYARGPCRWRVLEGCPALEVMRLVEMLQNEPPSQEPDIVHRSFALELVLVLLVAMDPERRSAWDRRNHRRLEGVSVE